MGNISVITIGTKEKLVEIFKNSRIKGSKFDHTVEAENLYRVKIDMEKPMNAEKFENLIHSMGGIENGESNTSISIILTRTLGKEDFTDSETFEVTLNIPGIDFERKEEAPGFFKIIVKITKPQPPALLVSIGKAMKIIENSPDESKE